MSIYDVALECKHTVTRMLCQRRALGDRDVTACGTYILTKHQWCYNNEGRIRYTIHGNVAFVPHKCAAVNTRLFACPQRWLRYCNIRKDHLD